MSNVISGTKTIAKNSIFLYTRMLLLMIISLVTVRIVLNSLGVEDYGIYSAVGGLVVSFSFLSQTLVSASQRFFSIDLGSNDKEGLNQSFNAVVISYIILSVILLVLFETIGLWFLKNKMVIPLERFSAALLLYQFSIYSFIFTILTNPFNALLISHEDMKPYMYISIAEAILKLASAFVLYYVAVDRLKLYGGLLLGTSIIIYVIYYLICRFKYKYISFTFKFDRNKIKDVFNFSSWTLFGTLAGVANNQGINLLLNLFYGPIANAAYSVSHQISSSVSQVVSNFYSAVRPPLTKSFALRNDTRTLDIFYFSSKVIFILLGVVAIPMYVCIEDLLVLWLGEVQTYMVSFSRLAIAYIFILSISHPITTIVHAAGRVKLYHLAVDGFALISMPLIWIAFKYNCIPEVAFYIANTVFVVAHMIRIFVMRRVVKFSVTKYICKYILPCIIITVITYFVTFASYGLFKNLFVKLFFLLCLSVICIVLLSYALLLSQHDKKSIKNILNMFVSKYKNN